MSAGTLYIAVKGDTKELVTSLKSAQSMSVKFGQDAKKAFDPVGKSLDYLKQQALALGAVWVGTQGIGAVIKIADQYSLLDSKLKLVSKSSQDFGAIYSELFKISQNTGSSFATNAGAYSNLALVLRDTGITSKETLGIIDMMTKSLVVAGAGAQESSSFMLQFKQALGSGRLAGEEFNAMMESNSYFGGLLAKTLGVNVGELKNLASEGKITTDVLRKAFPEMAAQIEKDFGGIQKTIGRAMVELQNAFNDIVADANKSEQGTNKVATSVSELAKSISEHKDQISDIFSGVIKSAEFAVTAISKVADAWMHIYLMSEAQANGKPLGEIFMMSSAQLAEWTKQNATMSQGMKDLVALRDKYLNVVEGYDKVLETRNKLFAAEQKEYDLAKAQVENLNIQIASHGKVAEAATSTVKAVESVAPAIVKNTELTDKQKKAAEDLAEKQRNLSAEITDYIQKQTLSEYDYKVWALGLEVEAKTKAAAGNKALIDQVHEYEKEKLNELAKFKDEKALEDQKRNAETTAAEIRAQDEVDAATESALDRMTSHIKSSKKTEVEIWKDTTDAEIAELERLSDGSKEYIDMLNAYKENKDKEYLDRLKKDTKDKLTEMEKMWADFGSDIKDDFEDVVADGLKGEFDSLGDAWESLTDAMLEDFLDLLAKMAVAWAAQEFTEWITGTSDGNWFTSLSGDKGKGGDDKSAGDTAAGIAGSLVTSYAKDAVADVVIDNVVTPVAEYVTTYITGSGAAAAIAAGSTSTSIAAGTATPAILDAYVLSQAAATDSLIVAADGLTVAGEGLGAAAESGVVAADSLTVAGEGLTTAAAEGGGAAAAEAGLGTTLGAIGAALAIMYTWGVRDSTDLKGELNTSGVSMDHITATSGIGQDGELVDTSGLTEQAKENLELLNGELMEFEAISLSSADGTMILADAVVNSESGMVEGMNWAMLQYDEATGQWTRSSDIWKNMMSEMEKLGPAAGDATDAAAEYVAGMAGVPSAADELAAAFEMIQTGVYDLAGAATGAAADIQDATSNLAGYYGDSPSDNADLGNDPGYDPDQTGPQVEAGHAMGGWLSSNPGGGWINKGSGYEDDVYLGSNGNTDHYGMGGEFVVNKRSAKKHANELNRINRDYASGGAIATQPAIDAITSLPSAYVSTSGIEEALSAVEQAAEAIRWDGVSDYIRNLTETKESFTEAISLLKGVAGAEDDLAIIRQAEELAIQELIDANREQIDSAKEQSQEMVDTSGMKDLEISLRELNASFDDTAESLTDLLASEEDLAVIEAARAIAIQDLYDANRAEIDSITEQSQEFLATDSLNDYEKSIHSLNKSYDEAIESLTGLSATEADLAIIEAARALESENLAEALAEQIASVVDPSQYIIDTDSLSDYEKSVHDINAAYDDTIASLIELEAAESDIATVEAARAIELANLADELAQADIDEASSKLREDIDEYIGTLQEAAIEADEALAKAEEALKTAFSAETDREIESFNSSMETMGEGLSAASDAVSTFSGLLDSIADDEILRESNFEAAQAELLRRYNTGDTSGDLSGLDSVTDFSTSQYGSSLDYRRELASTGIMLTALESSATASESGFEQQIELAENQHEESLKALDDQLNGLLGIDTSVLSVEDAILDYVASKELSEQANEYLEEQTQTLNAQYNALLEIDTSIADLTIVMSQFAALTAMIAEQKNEPELIVDPVRDQAEYSIDPVRNQVGFATGGSFTVGGGPGVDNLSLPKLRVTSGEMINITREDVMGQLVDEVRMLRAENQAQSFAIAKNTAQMAKYQRKWDEDGLPEVRA